MSIDISEDDIENSDEIIFVINYDNGTKFGFLDDNEVRYADVVIGGKGITMIVRLSG